jgi:hypothetical protein
VIEAALAHTIGNKVEAAYQRGDMFDKRRRLMEAWAQFCLSKPAEKLQRIATVALPSSERMLHPTDVDLLVQTGGAAPGTRPSHPMRRPRRRSGRA